MNISANSGPCGASPPSSLRNGGPPQSTGGGNPQRLSRQGSCCQRNLLPARLRSQLLCLVWKLSAVLLSGVEGQHMYEAQAVFSTNLQRLFKAGAGSSWVFKVAQIHNEISCTLNFRSTYA